MTTKKFECNTCNLPCVVEVTNGLEVAAPEKCIYHCADKHCKWIEVDLSNAESRLKALEIGFQQHDQWICTLFDSFEAEMAKIRGCSPKLEESRLKTLEYGLQLQAKLLGNITYSYDAELIKMRAMVREEIDKRLTEGDKD